MRYAVLADFAVCQANLPYRVPPPAKSAEQEAKGKAKASLVTKTGESGLCYSYTGRAASPDRRQFRMQRARQHRTRRSQHMRRQRSQHVLPTQRIRAISVAGPTEQFPSLAD